MKAPVVFVRDTVFSIGNRISDSILNTGAQLRGLPRPGVNFRTPPGLVRCGSSFAKFSRYTAICAIIENFRTSAQKCMWIRKISRGQFSGVHT
jgi:hypothetical protein